MAEPPPNPAAPRARTWQDAPTAPVMRGKERTRRRRLFGVVAGIGTLGALLLALLLLLHGFQPPFVLSVPVTLYGRQFPVNAQARPDTVALCGLFPGSQNGVDSQRRSLLLNQLGDLIRHADRTVVVHLSALGRVADGQVYLLPEDADPDKPDTWLALPELLTALHACPARQKVLLLDLARPQADPQLGVLADDVAEHLQPALEQAVAQDKDLWIFTPCSPGQTALASEELGQTVFGYYVVEGLRGAADGYNDRGQTDEHVSLGELAAYVTAHVDRWARQNRGSRQTPRLLGDAARARRVELTLTRQAARVAVERPELGAYPAGLLAGWQLHDRWRDEQVFQVAPQPYRELEATLLWVEQQWRGQNVAAVALEKDLRDRIEPLKERVAAAQQQVPRPNPPRSLALAAAFGEKPPTAKDVEALRALARDAVQAKKDKEAPAAQAKEALAAKREAVLKQLGDRPFARAWAAVEAAAGDIELDGPRLRFYRDFVQEEQPEPQYAEALCLARAAGVPGEAGDTRWPQDLVRLALRAARDRELAAACLAVPADGAGPPRLEPRALPWVARAVRAAAARHAEGEDLLLTGAPGARERARQPLEEAERAYQRILELIRAVARAEQLRQDAWSVLPACAPYHMDPPRPDHREEQDWDEAVRAARDLDGFLDRPAAAEDLATALAEVEKHRQALQGPLDSLRRRLLQDRLAPLKADNLPAQATPALLADADAVLGCPLLSAKDRTALWEVRQKLAKQLCERTQGDDQADSPDNRLTAPAPPDAAAAERAERERAARRARCLLDLLKVGGLEGGEALEKEVRALGPETPDKAREAAALHLRQAGTVTLVRQLREHLERARDESGPGAVSPDLVAADRLSRGVHPFDGAALAALSERGPAPAARLRRAEASALWRWLREFYLEEARRLAGEPRARDFYTRAAEDYLE